MSFCQSGDKSGDVFGNVWKSGDKSGNVFSNKSGNVFVAF